MREGSYSHRILLAIARHTRGVGIDALHSATGGAKGTMRVQVCRHVKKDYATATNERNKGEAAHIEHMVYRITDKGRDLLNQMALPTNENYQEELDDSLDNFQHKPLNLTAAIKKNPNSVWALGSQYVAG